MASELPIHGGFTTWVDDDVYEWAKESKWYLNTYGYPCRNVGYGPRGSKGRRTEILHRLVMPDRPDGYDTDHINRDPLDNRRSNLRFVSRKVNCLNSEKKRWYMLHNGKWRVRFKVSGMLIDVSGISTEEEAKSIAALLKGSLIYYELTKGGYPNRQ